MTALPQPAFRFDFRASRGRARRRRRRRPPGPEVIAAMLACGISVFGMASGGMLLVSGIYLGELEAALWGAVMLGGYRWIWSREWPKVRAWLKNGDP